MIRTLEDILTSTVRTEKNIQELIRTKEALSKQNTVTLKDTIQQLNENIYSNIQNQLAIIEYQLKMIRLIRPSVKKEELPHLSKLENEFLHIKRSFEALLESFSPQVNSITP